jgi:hypothetical protein
MEMLGLLNPSQTVSNGRNISYASMMGGVLFQTHETIYVFNIEWIHKVMKSISSVHESIESAWTTTNMTCGIHYVLKLADGKWVAMKKTYTAGIGNGRPLATIRFTVFSRLTGKASALKPTYIYAVTDRRSDRER